MRLEMVMGSERKVEVILEPNRADAQVEALNEIAGAPEFDFACCGRGTFDREMDPTRRMYCCTVTFLYYTKDGVLNIVRVTPTGKVAGHTRGGTVFVKAKGEAFTEERWTPPPMTEELLREFDAVLCQLSPENLCCDGELGHAEVMRKRTDLNRRWRQLEKRAGRSVSEDEVLKWSMPELVHHRNGKEL